MHTQSTLHAIACNPWDFHVISLDPHVQSFLRRPILSDEQWSAVSGEEVVHAFLAAEWDKWRPMTRWVDRRLVTEANLKDKVENLLRASILSAVRGPLLQQEPEDTQWFKVDSLRDEHLTELRVIGRCGLDDPGDSNELAPVAIRKPKQLDMSKMATWEAPVLWGHGKAGPFTILEGNHRLIAYAGRDGSEMSLNLPCYIGLSPSLCLWHLADQFKLEGV